MKSTTKKNNAQLNTEFSSEEIKAIADKAFKEAIAVTWRQTEVGRTFTQNDKIALVDEKTLVIGADVGSEKHDTGHLTTGGVSFQKSRLNSRIMRPDSKLQRRGF